MKRYHNRQSYKGSPHYDLIEANDCQFKQDEINLNIIFCEKHEKPWRGRSCIVIHRDGESWNEAIFHGSLRMLAKKLSKLNRNHK